VEVCSGSSRVAARCSPEENLVARGEAVMGKGFRRTGDDEVVVDDVDTSVSARDRVDNEGIWSLRFVWRVSAKLLVG
jgi:hypothetical protein